MNAGILPMRPVADLREKLSSLVQYRERPSIVERMERVAGMNGALRRDQVERVCARVGLAVLEQLAEEGFL